MYDYTLIFTSIFIFILILNLLYDFFDSNTKKDLLKIILILFVLLIVFYDKYVIRVYNGPTFIPYTAFKEYIPKNANRYITVDGERADYIVYWLSQADTGSTNNKFDSFGNFSNTGLVKVINNQATLYYNEPSQYVFSNYWAFSLFNYQKFTPKCVFYRKIYKNGFISSVNITDIT